MRRFVRCRVPEAEEMEMGVWPGYFWGEVMESEVRGGEV